MNGSLKFLEGAMGIIPRKLIDLFIEGIFPIVYLTTKGINQICYRNFQLVYGETKDQKKYELMTKRYIKSIGYAMMDLLYYVDRPKDLSKITLVENEDSLKEALKLGRGVIAVSAHFGNFPLMFVSLVQKGYKVNVVIRGMRDENFGKFMFQQCDKWGIKMIPTSPGKQFLKESLGALKRNELLFFLLDEVVPQQNGVKVNFFNREVIRAAGPVLFLERTSSPILPMFIVQDDKKHFKIFIERALEIYKGSDDRENLEKNIIGLNTVLEHFISRHPFQWGGWFNKKGFGS
jgi:KDO2-lipid IV(A) lauroyltransferase